MFTGIVEQVGRIKSIHLKNQSAILTIACKEKWDDLHIGDSVAVNGVCLTVTHINETIWIADVMAESIRTSTLGTLNSGSIVNLERAMAANGRFGGHIVSGHIDGTGKILRIIPEENAIWFTIGVDKKLLAYMVKKGSIAVDGVSLTIASLNEKSVSVSVIPHTRAVTTFLEKKVGDLVNIECDVIGKYVERLLTISVEKASDQDTNITKSLLTKYGFL